MPVNGLESLIERDLLRTSQIDPDLTKCGLGIDANHYLRQLYRRNTIKESLSAALGGIPLAFKSEVEKDLAKFKKFETRAMFVFDGLDLYNFNLKDEKTMKPDPFYAKRKSAWDAWTKLAEKGRYAAAEDREELAKQAREAFEAATSLPRSVERSLMDILMDNKIEFIVAPVSAKAQLAYFCNHPTKNFIDCIYSDPDVLLYEIDRVVLGIDFEAGTFTWVFKDDIRDHRKAAFNASTFHETFMDACIFAGGIYDCPSFPNIAESLKLIGPAFIFERAIDLLRTSNHGITVIRDFCADQNPEYLERFARTKAILTYMPIMKDNGYVETLSKTSVPNNIAMLVTPRLANEIYFYISRRLVGLELYDLLISDHLKIHAPLDGGESHEYRNLLNDMVPLRATCLSLLAGHSNRFLHHKHLTATYWYQPDVQVDLPPYHIFNISDAPYGRTKTWNVHKKTINSISKTSDIRGYTLALRGESFKRTIVLRSDDHLLASLEEMYANTWWRTLQLRQFINEDHSLTPWGIGLADGLEKLSPHKDLYEALYLGLELLRLRVLHHEDFSIKYSGSAMRGSDVDKKHIRYICRLACLTTLTQVSFPWKGPVSKAFLAFNSMVTEVSRNLRNLFEMVVLSMCVHGDVDRLGHSTIEWTQLGLMLPFEKELNTTLAILMRCKLEHMIGIKRNESVSVEKELYLIESDDFNSLAPDASAEIARMYALWDAFVVAVKGAHAAGATLKDNSKLGDELKKIEETNAWVAELRD